MNAPIILFCYNRPWHLQKTIEALQKNTLAKESDLYIYSDGGHDPAIQSVREYLRTISGFRSVKIIERERNYGLSENIIQGVTDIVNRYGKVIVLEDDIITSPYFLDYMNSGLDKYQEEPNVFCIHGYLYPIKTVIKDPFFIRGADCWGWGTWKRAWDQFEPNGRKLLRIMKESHLEREFDFDFSYPFTDILINQIRGTCNSWAIRWYASAFLKNGLCLYPNKSLVNNIGNDMSGTNCGSSNVYSTDVSDEPVSINESSVSESSEGRRAFMKYFLDNHTIMKRLTRLIKKAEHAYTDGKKNRIAKL